MLLKKLSWCDSVCVCVCLCSFLKKVLWLRYLLCIVLYVFFLDSHQTIDFYGLRYCMGRGVGYAQEKVVGV
jgi:hypothetical protein